MKIKFFHPRLFGGLMLVLIFIALVIAQNRTAPVLA